MKVLGFIFVLSTIFCQLFANNIYVNGSYKGEQESGTIAEPFKTIQQGVDAANEGDIIYIMSGTYREQVEIEVDSITITNYEDHKVTISGTEPVLEWEQYDGEVYRAIVPWDIMQNDESNQIFVDGKMMHLARWPKETSEHWVTDPTMAIVDEAKNSGSTSVLITDEEFDEPAERWLNGMIWINLANDADGQGWSGEASYISSTQNIIKASPTGFSTIFAGDRAPWAIRTGTHYYLFNPTPEGVYATGGPGELLARGEWWKTGDTLYVRLPNGTKPASEINQPNTVEAKKRLWAFLPKKDDHMHHVTIKGLHLFAASITTDKSFMRANLAVNSHHNIIDGIQAKYLTHFIDQTGHYQSQWYGKTGIILSGIENVLQNSTIMYTAAAGVSAFGERHKIVGNSFYETNYQCTEAGVINGGSNYNLIDPEVSYNYFNNTTQKVIAIGNIYSSNPEKPGLINLHHNVISNFMLRSSDSGGMNASAGRNWDLMRIHHNVILNSFTEVSIGIYTDYGGQAIIDHNLIWNVKFPILMNRYKKGDDQDDAVVIGNTTTPMGEIWVYNNLAINSFWNYGIVNNIVNPSGEGIYYKNNIISKGIRATLDLVEALDSNLYITKNDAEKLFIDFENLDFRLNPESGMAIDKGVDASPFNDEIINNIPDIGPFEHGAEPWIAGPEGVITYLKMDKPKNLAVGDTTKIHTTAYSGGLQKMDPQPKIHYWTNGFGTIDTAGYFIATEATDEAIVYATADSLTIESVSFRVNESITDAINNYNINQNDDFQMKVFPNPVEENLTLEVECNGFVSNSAVIEIYSLTSRILYRNDLQLNSSKTQYTIDTSWLNHGIYIIRVSNESSQKYLKFTKSK